MTNLLSLVSPGDPAYAAQCTSTLTGGETLSWERPSQVSGSGSWFWAPASTRVQSETLPVYGVPINGLNVATPSSTGASASDRASFTSSVLMTAASSSQPSSTPPGSGNSFVGIAIGASVGAVMGVSLLALGVFPIWRSMKRRPGPREWDAWKHGKTRPSGESAAVTKDHMECLDRRAYHSRASPVEIGTSTHYERCELSVSPDDGPGRELRGQTVNDIVPESFGARDKWLTKNLNSPWLRTLKRTAVTRQTSQLGLFLLSCS